MKAEIGEMSDAELLRQYVTEQDTAAMEELFSRHADRAYRTALRVTRNAADAEDAAQAAFVSIMRDARKYRGAEGVGIWIAKYAMNSAKVLIRGAVRRRAREETVVRESEAVDEENTMGKDDVTGRIRRLLDGLPERYRLPVWLHHGEGMPFADVGRALSVPEVTARSHASRGVAMLREKLARTGMPVPVASVTAAFGILAGEEGPPALRSRIGPLVEYGGRSGLSPGARSLVARIASQGMAWTRLAIAATIVAAVAGTVGMVALRSGKEPAPHAEERPWPSRYVPGPILFEKDFSEGLEGWTILEAPVARQGQVEWQSVSANEAEKRGIAIAQDVQKDGNTISVLEINVPQDSENRTVLKLKKDIEAPAFSIEWTVRLGGAGEGLETSASAILPGIRHYRKIVSENETPEWSAPRVWHDWRAEFTPLPNSDPPGGMLVADYREDQITLQMEIWTEAKQLAQIEVVRGRVQVARVTVRELVPVWD